MPKASRTIQGRIQSRNLPVEQRFRPRMISCLSKITWLSMLGLRLGSARGNVANPFAFGAVVDLRFGSELGQEAERFRAVRQAGDFTRRVVQVAEDNGARRAGFGAGRLVIGRVDFAPPFGRGLGFR